MPADFKRCILDVTTQQTKKGKSDKDAKASAFAICTSRFKKAGRRYKEMKNMKINFVVPIVESYSENTTDDGILRIEGVAIEETTSRNNVTYEIGEISKAAETLVGVPLLKDHENTVDGIVGRVTEAYVDGKQLKFKADVVDESMQKKIRSGLIRNVSVGSKIEELKKIVEDGVTNFVAKSIEFLELSLVAIPGVPGATFSARVTEAYNSFESKEQEKMERKLEAIEEKLALLLKEDAEETEAEPEAEAEKEKEAEAEPEAEENDDAAEEKLNNMKSEISELKSHMLDLTKEVIKSRAITSENVKALPEWVSGELKNERGNYWQEWDMAYWREHHPLAKL